MMENGKGGWGGLIIEITDGDFFSYRGNIFYDLVKTSVIRLAFAMGYELRKRDITAVALTPGFLRSEAMLDHFGVTEETWERWSQEGSPFHRVRDTALRRPCGCGPRRRSSCAEEIGESVQLVGFGRRVRLH